VAYRAESLVWPAVTSDLTQRGSSRNLP